MTLQYIDNEEYKNKIEKLYLESFPEEERFPFWILDECSKEANSDLLAILDNDRFIGMCYLVNCNNAYYLMYLAVEPELRSQNYGYFQGEEHTDQKEKGRQNPEVLLMSPAEQDGGYMGVLTVRYVLTKSY